MKTGFAIALLALAMLCTSVLAQENTAGYWIAKAEEQSQNSSFVEASSAYEKSLELFNNGSLEESLQAVEKAIDLDPKNATLWAHKASCLNMAGVITQNLSRFDESLQSYDKAIELDPENTTYLLWKGYAFRQSAYGLNGVESTRAFEKALEVFDDALKVDPKYAQAWSGKGVIYDDLAIFNDDFARYNDSLAAHDKALQLTPANDSKNLAQAYEGRAVVLSHLGQSLAAVGRKDESKASLEEAVENYDKVIELDPELVGQEALQNRAEVLDELGRRNESSEGLEKAMERLNRSIEVCSNNSGAWVGKAFLFRELGRHEAAVEALNNATQITPEYVLAWEVKGEILSNELGRFDESIEAYERALQLDATDIKAWTGKGDALRSLGRNREAVQAYERALKIDHDRAAAWSGKGAALKNMGRYNESIQAYDGALHAIEQNPVSSSASLAAADAWFGKAEALVGPDRAEEAADACNRSLLAYEKSTQIDSESAKAWTGKGNVLLSLKRYNESIQAYEKSLEILNQSIEMNPKDSEAYWLMAENLDNLGRSEAALEAYDRVIDLKSSKALGAWIRKSDIFVSLGKYNKSVEAFDCALNLLPTEDKQSVMNLWWTKGITVYHNAWIADGQIIRVTSAWYNESAGNFENIMLVNSDFVTIWHNPTRGKNVSPDGKPLGKNDEALQAWSTNWAQYGFPDAEDVGRQ
jgi:tetratricopeptide (TPR) repeat protein